MKRSLNEKQVAELLHQALETERGGIQVYKAALQAVLNADLKKEFQRYLEQTRRHEEVLTTLFEALGMDPEGTTPGREVVKFQGKSLVEQFRWQ
jgi:rubrerythrin